MAYRFLYYRNYDSEDETGKVVMSSAYSYQLSSIDDFNWSPPTGYVFKEWNRSSDGTGDSGQPGENANAGTMYAIWEPIPDPVPYITTDQELTSIANAIRTKGGTSESLTYPAGFVNAINAIPTVRGINYDD